MTAQELQNKVCQTEKENKYKDMVKIQNEKLRPHIGHNMEEYNIIIRMIERANKDSIEIPYSVHGDTIMADTERAANVLADFLEYFGGMPTTGYYDPEEDKRSGEVDSLTGLWYVDVL